MFLTAFVFHDKIVSIATFNDLYLLDKYEKFNKNRLFVKIRLICILNISFFCQKLNKVMKIKRIKTDFYLIICLFLFDNI